MFTEPMKGVSGYFAVDWQDNFPHWFAWREWYHEVFGKSSFPRYQTVLFAWPPTSGQGANAVGDWLKQLREEIERDGQKRPNGKSNWKPIPEFAAPWREWDPSYRRDLVAMESDRRNGWGPAFASAPQYPWRHKMGSRYPAPMPATPGLARKYLEAAE